MWKNNSNTYFASTWQGKHVNYWTWCTLISPFNVKSKKNWLLCLAHLSFMLGILSVVSASLKHFEVSHTEPCIFTCFVLALWNCVLYLDILLATYQKQLYFLPELKSLNLFTRTKLKSMPVKRFSSRQGAGYRDKAKWLNRHACSILDYKTSPTKTTRANLGANYKGVMRLVKQHSFFLLDRMIYL